LLELEPHLVAHRPSRLRAGWPEELNAAVDKALTAGEKRPPEGVTQADWERVLDRHRQDKQLSAAQMRRLGPEVAEDEILVTVVVNAYLGDDENRFTITHPSVPNSYSRCKPHDVSSCCELQVPGRKRPGNKTTPGKPGF
jgi:hypothetical protein